ncbi:MAG: zinc-binding alcohol dehydrogenase [Bacteroides sp. SM23_62_1]|nr:MAG: zinc-binding alcohol dehydrogenase [Bacteroides sp. SM23_62_1]
MKALVLEDYMKLIYKDVPDPVIGPDEVLIAVKAVGICGSDIHGMDGSTGRRIPPLIMGHEASGLIVETGKDVRGWKTGDRVTFDSTIYRLDDPFTRKGMYNLSDGRVVLGVSTGEFKRDGAMAEYVSVPQHILYKIPDHVSFTSAAMVEPAAVAMHAIAMTPCTINETAVVFGSGMVGSFLIQLLKINGCGRIIALDVDDDRIDLALRLGATHGFNTRSQDIHKVIMELTGELGADIAFEVVGNSETVNAALKSIRKGGTLTLIGNLSPMIDIPLQFVVTRQIRLQGSYAIAGEYPIVLDLISRGRINTEAILSIEAPLSDGAMWFEKLYRKEKGLMKVVLIP